jgi:GAF domain-containing protein
MTQSIGRTRVHVHAHAFAELAVQLHDTPTTAETADAVVRYAIPAIGCDHAGIALQDTNGVITIGTVSSDVPRQLYDAQIYHGDGPMIAAIQHSVVLHIPSAAGETRWPAWSRRAVELGVGSVVHLPLRSGNATLGALSVYKEACRGFSDDDLAIAHVLARHASIAVATAQRREDMTTTIDARKLVGQAMGILMEHYDLDSERAFAVLQRYAEASGLKLQQAAEHVTADRRFRRSKQASAPRRSTVLDNALVAAPFARSRPDPSGLRDMAIHLHGRGVERGMMSGMEDARPKVPVDADSFSAADSAAGASADGFAQLASELHGSEGVEETVETVVQFALQALNCSHAGVALARRGQPEVPAATDPVVAQIYQWQMEAGRGPLVESMREHTTLLVRDTGTDERWPDWAGKVRSLGVRSVLDVPLTTAAGTVGVLGLYSVVPDAFSDDDEAIAHILARHASVAVATARNEENMAQAVDARKLVGQAMGILMERYDVNGDQAFAILKRYSQDTNTKLRDVAQHLIDTRRLPR